MLAKSISIYIYVFELLPEKKAKCPRLSNLLFQNWIPLAYYGWVLGMEGWEGIGEQGTT